MIVLKLGGEILGRGTRSSVHDHHQRAAPHTLVVGVLHGTEDKRCPRLGAQGFRIGRGQEAGRKESIAEERARGMLALPERGGIARRFGFRSEFSAAEPVPPSTTTTSGPRHTPSW